MASPEFHCYRITVSGAKETGWNYSEIQWLLEGSV
jgi:hypothetical protein